MPESDPHELAGELERETARLEHEIERLGDEVSSARDDWEQKRSDTAIPGAPPTERPEGDEDPDASQTPG
jgi:hypothetical protein